MATFVCLLFDLEDDVVIAAEIIEAAATDEARMTAERRVQETEEAASFELWRDGIRVATGFPRKGTK